MGQPDVLAREAGERELDDLRKTLGRELRDRGPQMFERALADIGYEPGDPITYAFTSPGAATLSPGDRMVLQPRYGWSGPTVEHGCLVFTANLDEECKVMITHPDGTWQRYPAGICAFAKDAKVYVSDGVVGFPGGHYTVMPR